MNVPPAAASATQVPKAIPQLVEGPPGRWRRFVDLAGLAAVVFLAAPLPCALWTVVALGRGLLVPAQLWLTKALVDALAARGASRSFGSGSWWPRCWWSA